MLPDILLDNEKFDKIMENARNMIVSIYPEWTDFNYHDPGVTILELFSWLKESQQYYINKIGPENRLRYLKLLGMRRRHKKPAEADVTLTYEDDIITAGGTRFFAGGLCFEAAERTYVPSARIKACVCVRGEEVSVTGAGELSFGGRLRLRPFGIRASDKEAFYIGFDKPLPTEEICTLGFGMAEDGGTARNPIPEGYPFLPLADIAVEYFNGAVWMPAEIVSDTTHAFLMSGKLSFRLPENMVQTDVGGESAYYLRIRITDGEYDTRPCFESLDFGFVRLLQQDTRVQYADFAPGESCTQTTELALTGKTRLFTRGEDGLFTEVSTFTKYIDEESGNITLTDFGEDGICGIRAVSLRDDFYANGLIGTGTGLPYQEFDLGRTDIEYDSFSIMTEMPDSGGKFAEWKKVPDFSRSGPADLHYVFESDRGIIRFGDCIRGTAPEGGVIVTGCRYTAGAEGNIAKNKINTIDGFDSDTVQVTNSRAAFGGQDEESLAQCIARTHEILSTTETMVTAEDCENRIRSCPGLRIEKCRVVDMGKTAAQKRYADIVTSVVIKPYSEDGRGVPGKRYVENILAYAEKYRMMGTRVSIVIPDYTDITVFADVNVEFGSINAQQLISDAVNEYFLSIRDDFGTKVSYSTVYNVIDSLECVVSVNTLTIDASGSDVTRTREGDLILGPNVTAVLADSDYIINTVY